MVEAFTAEQKLQCLQREIKQRRRVYDRLVQSDRMTQGEAKYEIAVMSAIATDYEKLAEQERLL